MTDSKIWAPSVLCVCVCAVFNVHYLLVGGGGSGSKNRAPCALCVRVYCCCVQCLQCALCVHVCCVQCALCVCCVQCALCVHVYSVYSVHYVLVGTGGKWLKSCVITVRRGRQMTPCRAAVVTFRLKISCTLSEKVQQI